MATGFLPFGLRPIRREVDVHALGSLARSDRLHEGHEVIVNDDQVLSQARGWQFALPDVLEEGVRRCVYQFRRLINVQDSIVMHKYVQYTEMVRSRHVLQKC